jgi:hypothetical protein
MKWNIILVLGIACIAASVLPVAAGDVPTVTISSYVVSPSVLLPDTLGTITVTVKNTATSASITDKSSSAGSDYNIIRTTDINAIVENIHLEGNGISVLTKDFRRVGSLGPGQSMPVTFSIRTPSKSDMYYPEVWIDTQGGTSTKYPIPVNVNTSIGIQKEAILILTSTLPESINPGDTIPVTLTVQNAGQLLADDVTLTVQNVTGSLAPASTDAYHLGMIAQGTEKSVPIVLLSDRLGKTGLVRVPVVIDYHSVDGTPLNVTTGIDVKLLGNAELGFVSVDTNPARLSDGTPFDLTIRIENTGTGEARQVSAKIDLPVEGTREAFIGKIKNGNDAPAIFLLEGMPGGNYPYNLTIRYIDDMGQHTMTRQMNLRVPPADYTGTIIFVLIILGILGFIGYRYWYLPRHNGNGKFPWERKS